MSLRQKAVRGVVWSAIQSWVSRSISFVVFFLLARLLAPEAFGLVALASVFLAFVQIFLDQGFSQAIVQRQELQPEHLDTAFWINIGIGGLLTALSITCASLVANFYREPQLIPVLRWLSLSFLFLALSSVQQAILQRKLAFKALAIRSLAAVCVGGIVGVVMALVGLGVWSLVGQQLTGGLTQALVLWWISDWQPRFRFSIKHFKDLFAFGINVLGIRILNFFNRRSDDLLIGYFLGTVALGYYSVAYRILLIMTELLTGVTEKVAMPAFAQIQKEPERLQQAFYNVTQLMSLVSFPLFLGMAVLAPEMIQVLFGEKWLPSVPVMQVLAFIGILHSVYYFNGTVIVAMGKPFWKLLLNSLNAIVNVFAFLLVIRWGIVAVAIAYVSRGYLLSPLPLLAVQKLIHINSKTYLRKLAIPIISSVIMTAALLGGKFLFGQLMLEPHIMLIVCMFLGIAIYILTVFLIAPEFFRKVLGIVNSALTIQ